MIYIFRQSMGRQSFLKVGHAKNVANRMKSHRTSSPVHLEVLMLRDGMKKEETDIHGDLNDFRVRGEWFHDTPEVYKCLGLANPDEYKDKKKFSYNINALSRYFYTNTHAAHLVDELLPAIGFHPLFWEDISKVWGPYFEVKELETSEIKNRNFYGTPYTGKRQIIMTSSERERFVEHVINSPSDALSKPGFD